jgi:hypothetical protein
MVNIEFRLTFIKGLEEKLIFTKSVLSIFILEFSELRIKFICNPVLEGILKLLIYKLFNSSYEFFN